MMDPASYLLISSTNNTYLNTFENNHNCGSCGDCDNCAGYVSYGSYSGDLSPTDGLSNSINSSCDFERSTGSEAPLLDRSVVDDYLITDDPLTQNHHHYNTDTPLLIGDCQLSQDDEDDLIHRTLTSFVRIDPESESDMGYASEVLDGLLFTSSASPVDCSDSVTTADTYCLRQLSFSDLQYGGLIDVAKVKTPKQLSASTEKRSVLMNLLIYGSDIEAGYTNGPLILFGMGPDPDYSDLREFDIVFEVAFTDEQSIEIPYWTKVDHVAKINPADFVRYDLAISCIEKPRLLPFSTLNKGRRLFDISQDRLNSHRKVKFSPRVDVKPIELKKCNDSIDDEEYFTGQAALWDGLQTEPGTHVIDLDEIAQQEHKPGSSGAAGVEVLNENLEDLVPPDFDVMETEFDKIFTASATNGLDSDSVSCFSSDEDLVETQAGSRDS